MEKSYNSVKNAYRSRHIKTYRKDNARRSNHRIVPFSTETEEKNELNLVYMLERDRPIRWHCAYLAGEGEVAGRLDLSIAATAAAVLGLGVASISTTLTASPFASLGKISGGSIVA